MSKVADPPPFAELPSPPPLRRWFSWRRLGFNFLTVSIALHLLFALVAGIYVVQIFSPSRKLTFKAGPPSPNQSTRTVEHKVKLAAKMQTMSAPPTVKRVISTGLSKIVLPVMPAISTSDSAPSRMAA